MEIGKVAGTPRTLGQQEQEIAKYPASASSLGVPIVCEEGALALSSELYPVELQLPADLSARLRRTLGSIQGETAWAAQWTAKTWN